MDNLSLRVAARFIAALKTSPVPRIEHILLMVPTKLDVIHATVKNPIENGKKLPKTKVNARVDALIDDMHKLLMEYQSLSTEARLAVEELPQKERREALHLLQGIEQKIPSPQQVKITVKTADPRKLREDFQRVLGVWRRVDVMLSGQKMLFAATKKPLHTFKNEETQMASYVWLNDKGTYNVTVQDLDSEHFLPYGHVNIPEEKTAIATAKRFIAV